MFNVTALTLLMRGCGWPLRLVAIAVVLGLTLMRASTRADDFAAELPRVPPLDAVAAIASLRVQPEFKIQLAADESLLASPVAIAWDEDGRLFVAEMRGYSERQGERLGRVRLLHDDNDDGMYDRATVFADGLAWPTAICCYDGGVFVGDAPEILFLKDINGDGVADQRHSVFTGFGDSNVQGLMNSFHFGLDNRIHGSASAVGGTIRRPSETAKASKPVVDSSPAVAGDGGVNVSGRDFSFDPRSLTVRPETGGAQHGMSFDAAGGKYVCSNSDQAIRCMIDDRFLSRNPFYTPPSAKISVAAEGPQGAVFRSSPVEPWRILRTRLRASGLATGPIEAGGRSSGYFTSATGVTVVGGDAFGDALAGMLVIGDVGSNLVHRKRLTPDGSCVRAERVDRESELIASTDNWFRPVQFSNGPDGGLWIIDMQREVIEHPLALPLDIKKHLDLDSGRDRGRLWRLVPQNFSHRRTPKLSGSSTAELVELLEHPNAWHRETAKRLLYERRDPAAAVPLAVLAANPQADPRGRIAALYVLDGLGALCVADLDKPLNANDPLLRSSAVRLLERFVGDGDVAQQLANRMVEMAVNDPDPRVRLELALIGGGLSEEMRTDLLSKILLRDGGDAWCRMAAFTSMGSGAGRLLVAWLGDPRSFSGPGAPVVLSELAAQVGRRGDDQEVAAVVEAIGALADEGIRSGSQLPGVDGRAIATTVLVGLVRSLEHAGGSTKAIGSTDKNKAVVQRLVAWNRAVAADAAQPTQARLAAIRGLFLAPLPDVVDLFATLLAPNTQPDSSTASEIAKEVITVLGQSHDPSSAAVVLQAWPTLSAELRAFAAAMLNRNPHRAEALLNAIDAGVVREADIERTVVTNLRNYPVESIRKRAMATLGPVPVVRRDELVEAYRPCLTATGNPEAGKSLFSKHCSSCHKVGDIGRETGPNLVAMQARGVESILLGILDPNREVQPQYFAHTAITDDGRVITGVLVAESSTSITLRGADGNEETIARQDLEELRSSKRSLMPEGFEREIDLRGMGDLLAWLMTAR